MNIAIIGGGIAGLSAASDLHTKGHRVTVYEKNSEIGGHVSTVAVPIEKGQNLLVELGVVMHDPEYIHPTLNQYVKKFDLTISEFPLSFSFENQHNQLFWTTQSRFQGFLRELSILTNVAAKSIANGKIFQNLSFLWELRRFLEMMPAIRSEKSYQHMSLAEFIKQENFSQSLLNNWFKPQCLCWWGVTDEFFMNTSIQVITESFYLVSKRPQYHFKKGWTHFLKKFAEPYKERIRTRSPVKSISRNGGLVTVHSLENHETYDAVVIATPPNTASALLTGKTEEEQKILNAFTTLTTTVYLHRDPLWMPKKEEWATVNLVQDEKGHYITYWCGALHEQKPHIFLTWGDRLDQTPAKSSLIATKEWLRTLPTVEYTYACHGIEKIQGKGSVWYAGAHIDALDPKQEGIVPSLWHENALKSGLRAAENIQTRKTQWEALSTT